MKFLAMWLLIAVLAVSAVLVTACGSSSSPTTSSSATATATSTAYAITITGTVNYSPGSVSSTNQITTMVSNANYISYANAVTQFNAQQITTNGGAINLPVTGTGPFVFVVDYNTSGDHTASTSFHVGDSKKVYGGCAPSVDLLTASTNVGALSFDATDLVYGLAGTVDYTGSVIGTPVITMSLYEDSGYTERLNTNTDYAGDNDQLYELPDVFDIASCTSRTVYLLAWAHTGTAGSACSGSSYSPCPGDPYIRGSYTTSTTPNQNITFGDTNLWP